MEGAGEEQSSHQRDLAGMRMGIVGSGWKQKTNHQEGNIIRGGISSEGKIIREGNGA